jgi:uncharacterized protein YjiS (DUF1127 family)
MTQHDLLMVAIGAVIGVVCSAAALVTQHFLTLRRERIARQRHADERQRERRQTRLVLQQMNKQAIQMALSARDVGSHEGSVRRLLAEEQGERPATQPQEEQPSSQFDD